MPELTLEKLAHAYLLLAGRLQQVTGLDAAHSVVTGLRLALREDEPSGAIELVQEGFEKAVKLEGDRNDAST